MVKRICVLVGISILLMACGSAADKQSTTSGEDDDTSATTSTAVALPDPSTYANGILNGTWDYVFTPAQAELVLNEFRAEGLIESAEEVILRIGVDNHKWWLGYVFDGELFLLGGHPEGAGGTFRIEDDLLISDEGDYETVDRLDLSGDSLTLTWISACDKSGSEPVCTETRTPDIYFPPGADASTDLAATTFTKSSDDPSY